jgi:hypothetical protein
MGPLDHPHHHLWPSAQQTTKKGKNINVIILEETKNLHFVGQMFKGDYYTKEQMNKYEMQADINKAWLHTLQFFTKPFAQHKAYREDRAANCGFDSAAHINDIATNRSLVSTSSDFATRDLYIESLEELLAALQEYVAKERAPTLDKPDPADLLRTELDAQHKQFDLIMKHNSALLPAISKGNDGGGGGGGGGGGSSGNSGRRGGSSNRHHDQGTNAMCPNCNKLVVHAVANCFTLPANKDKIPTWYKPPKLDSQRQGSLDSINIDNWITCNKPKHIPPTITLCNYWTPLTSHVEVLEPTPCPPESLLLACQRANSYTNKDSMNYQ